MKFKVFTVYDDKVEAFLQPFFNPTRGAAIRAFADTCNDPNTAFNKHPADYTLFEIGDYDDEKGYIEMYDAKHGIGTALEFIEANKGNDQ